MMILIVSAVTFALLSSAGGDAFSSLRDNPQVSAETVENLRSIYGLDRPIAVRYGTWLWNAVRGEMGESFYFRTPVRNLVISRFVSTLSISLAAILLAMIIAAVLGILSARYRWKWISRFIEVLILLASSTPRIVLALFGLALIARSDDLSGFLVAAMVMAVPVMAIVLAQFHGGLIIAMNEDFVQLARAKGLSERVVIVRHVLRAALDPVLTVLGLSFGSLLGGSILVESILGRQGLGSLMVAAVRGRDIPLIMGVVLLASSAVWIGNTVAEFLQMLNDKRRRLLEIQ